MADLVRGPNGEYGVYDPMTGVQEISQEEYEQRKLGRAERAAGGFVDRLQDAAGEITEFMGRGAGTGTTMPGITSLIPSMFAPEAAQNEVTKTGLDIQRQNDPRQEARRAVDPAMANVGAGLGIAAEAVVPLPGVPGAVRGSVTPRVVQRASEVVDHSRSLTAQSSLARRMAQGVREGAQELGARARNTVTNRPTTLGQALRNVEPNPYTARRGQSSVGAGEVGAERTVASGFGNVSSDIPLSGPEARWAAATTDDARDLAVRDREIAQVAKDNTLNPAGVAQREVEDARQGWGTRRIMDELGLADKGHTRFTDEALAEGFRQEQSVFRQYIDNAADNDMPIQARWSDDAADTASRGPESSTEAPVLSLGDRASEILDTVPEALQTRSLRNAVDELAAISEAQTVDGKQFQTVWNHVRKARDRFANRGTANPENAAAMGDLMELMQEALQRSLPNEGVERLGMARRRWGILNDLTRGKVIDQNSGTVNFRTFRNNRARRDGLFRSGRRSGQNFEADMRFLAALDEEMVPRTGARLASQVGGIAKTLGVGAAGAGAASWLFD